MATVLGPYVRSALMIAELEARKMRRDPTEMLTRAIQPALWLLVFGQVVGRAGAFSSGTGLPYIDYLAPGILAQSVLFVAIFYGIAVIWERDLGILQKFLASPAPRSAIVLGKGLSAGVRALGQVLLVYLLCVFLRVHLSANPLRILGVLAAVFLGATFFATLSVILASVVKSRERFLGIGQVLTFPLFFASNAIYPIAAMPPWLQAVAHANPLTYEVDVLRHLMLRGPVDVASVALDFVVLLGVTAWAVYLGGRLYPKVVTQ